MFSTHNFIPKRLLGDSISGLKKIFTVSDKYQEKSVKVYKETINSFGLPRYYKNFTRGVDATVAPRLRVPFRPLSVLWKKQPDYYNAFLSDLKGGGTGFFIHAQTATGKTVIALHCAAKLNTQTLVIVPRKFLIDQWIERIIEHTSLEREDIGIIQGDTVEYKNKSIVVATIQTIWRKNFPSDFLNWPGAIIFDEVHTTAAEKFSESISMFPAKYRIGLTASTRKDGLENVYMWAIGENYYNFETEVPMSPKVLIQPYYARTVNKRVLYFMRNARKLASGPLLTELAEDPERNAILLKPIIGSIRKGRRTLVLGDRTDQLKRLCHTVKAQTGVENMGCIIGDTKQSVRRKLLADGQAIFATKSIFSMALDEPDLSNLIIVTPSKDAQQMAGRVLRYCAGKSPVIFEILDKSYPLCVRWGNERLRYYQSIKSEIKILRN